MTNFDRHLSSAAKGIAKAQDSLRLAFEAEPGTEQEFHDEHRPAEVLAALDWIGVTIIRLEVDE